ncbi:MAG: 5'/3'-nucleotidase SurE [SAR324 cluster bacterium]|nr:5'/3'-nucleotidase SurE [SAR324 cluster bacterium]
MPDFLLVNDDGVHSPMLAPTIHHLRKLGTVRLVVPAEEQSWKSKAMSRFGELIVRAQDGFGIEAYTVTGTPADCVNLGVHRLFSDPPDWVISGINIGDNLGLAFVLNSGTVGAAFESALLGIPAVAFSHHVTREMYFQWSDHGRLAGAAGEKAVANAAAAVGRLMPAVLAHGLPAGAMMLNINFPQDVNANTAVRWTRLQNNRYGSLFEPEGAGYRHRYRGDTWSEAAEHNDREVLESGAISVTPLTLDGLNLPYGEPFSFS